MSFTSTTLPRFISALIHSSSAISQNKNLAGNATQPQPQYQEVYGTRQLAMYMESKERMHSYSTKPHPQIYIYKSSGKILSRHYRETKHQIGMALLMAC